MWRFWNEKFTTRTRPTPPSPRTGPCGFWATVAPPGGDFGIIGYIELRRGYGGVVWDALSPRDVFEAPPGGGSKLAHISGPAGHFGAKMDTWGFWDAPFEMAAFSRLPLVADGLRGTGFGVGAPSARACQMRERPCPRGHPLGFAGSRQVSCPLATPTCQTERFRRHLTFLHRRGTFRGMDPHGLHGDL